MLKQAFNLVMKIHSQQVVMKRLGAPDLFSPCRIAPSNYFRFLESVSATTVHGREFIIPIDSLTGTTTQRIRFFTTVDDAEVPAVPTEGSFHLTYGMADTPSLNFDVTFVEVQAALRTITGLENVVVTGDFSDGFIVEFIGVNTPSLLVPVQEDPELDCDIGISVYTSVQWNPIIERGDKILHPTYGNLALKEIIEMPDIGGSIMGYRVRAE